MSQLGDATFEDAVRRIYGRYVREVVEAFSFCPWALKARETGKVALRVCPQDSWDVSWALRETEQIAADDRFEIGILIFPRLDCDFAHFGRRVSELRQAHGANHPSGAVPLAMAPFHPEGSRDVTSPGRLTSFVRRSPDPTVQLVRRSVLNDIRRNEQRGTDYIDLEATNLEQLLATPVTQPIHQRVLEANEATLASVGTATVERVLTAIAKDRDKSYGRFLS